MAADAVECCDLARRVAVWLTYALGNDSCCGHHSPDDDSRMPCGEDVLSILPMPLALWFAPESRTEGKQPIGTYTVLHDTHTSRYQE